MATIRLLSGGAAQAVVEKVAIDFRRNTGNDINADFSAVGAMKAKFLAGEAADLLILTAPLIDELMESGHIVPGSRTDLGRVGTGVAVRLGTPLPDVSNAGSLRAAILAATKIVCPDPAVATAGKVVMAMLDKLGIASQVKDNMQYFPNGYAAMGWLAASPGKGEMGITQITEILPNKGVTLAGPLPEELQMKTIYCAGLAAQAPHPDAAKDFMLHLTAPAAREILAAAGYELD